MENALSKMKHLVQESPGCQTLNLRRSWLCVVASSMTVSATLHVAPGDRHSSVEKDKPFQPRAV